ncbi:MAG: DUF2147 domain-containing protein [Tannerellaceae bacterium]
MKKFFSLFILCMISAMAMAQTGGDALINCVWNNTSGTNKIQFFKESNGTYYAKIVWLKDALNSDGTPKLDTKNPDKAKRSDKLKGTSVVWGLKYEDGKWADGTLYSPTKGMIVKGSVTLNDKGQLMLKGTKWGISQTETFNKEALK